MKNYFLFIKIKQDKIGFNKLVLKVCLNQY